MSKNVAKTFFLCYIYGVKQDKGGRKMKSNKGFTLIELLAVIVILAIIALIATPTILSVIETARKGSAESSVLGYIDAVEKQIAIDMLETDKDKRIFDSVVSSSDTTVSITIADVDEKFSVKGQKPTAGTLTYDSKKGIITTGTNVVITLNSKPYCVQYYGEATTVTVESKSKTYSAGTAVATAGECPTTA
jgi:type IV pilus assembly protein PilA